MIKKSKKVTREPKMYFWARSAQKHDFSASGIHSWGFWVGKLREKSLLFFVLTDLFGRKVDFCFSKFSTFAPFKKPRLVAT